jgi:hypothetical protein
MKIYSIVRIGNEYVVQAEEKSVLKIATKRKAAKLVTEAAELLESQSEPPRLPPQGESEPSIGGDPSKVP